MLSLANIYTLLFRLYFLLCICLYKLLINHTQIHLHTLTPTYTNILSPPYSAIYDIFQPVYITTALTPTLTHTYPHPRKPHTFIHTHTHTYTYSRIAHTAHLHTLAPLPRILPPTSPRFNASDMRRKRIQTSHRNIQVRRRYQSLRYVAFSV